MEVVDIAIVGGGLGGLALALALQERGIRAHVFDKAPRVRKHSGTSISIARNGLRALDGTSPGLSIKVTNQGCAIKATTAIMRTPGEEKLTKYLMQPGQMLTIPWKSAQQVLVDQLNPQILHYRHAFTTYRASEAGVEACFEVADDTDPSRSSTKVVRAKVLIGADGMSSQVRKIMVGDDPRDLRLIYWNALVPVDRIRSLNLHEENEIRLIRYPAEQITIFLVDAGLGYTLWQVRVPDVNGEITKALDFDFEASGENVRKVRTLKALENVENVENLRVAIRGTDPNSIREGISFDRLPLTKWRDPSGRVLLIADAAHGMYSGPGEGARTAFEDAHQLSMLFHEAFSSPDPNAKLLEALKRFEEIRVPRLTKIQAFAGEMTGWPEFIPEWVQNMPPEDRAKRFAEFTNWTRSYPDNMNGDPNSTYWKP